MGIDYYTNLNILKILIECLSKQIMLSFLLLIKAPFPSILLQVDLSL